MSIEKSGQRSNSGQPREIVMVIGFSLYEKIFNAAQHNDTSPLEFLRRATSRLSFISDMMTSYGAKPFVSYPIYPDSIQPSTAANTMLIPVDPFGEVTEIKRNNPALYIADLALCRQDESPAGETAINGGHEVPLVVTDKVHNELDLAARTYGVHSIAEFVGDAALFELDYLPELKDATGFWFQHADGNLTSADAVLR